MNQGLAAPSSLEQRAPNREYSCFLCQHRTGTRFDGEKCPACGEATRTRSLAPIVACELRPYLAQLSPNGRLLAFSMTTTEWQLIEPCFAEVVSVSLLGEYGDGRPHLQGVDIRDLSRFAPASFGAVFGIIILDHLLEIDRAAAEVFRVLEPGGIFLTLLSSNRIRDGWEPPAIQKQIETDPGYYAYVPAGISLISITVGRLWLLREMHRAGFRARQVAIEDGLTGEISFWFIGSKPFTS